MVRKIIGLLAIFLFLCAPAMAAQELDANSDGFIDVAIGGTGANTSAMNGLSKMTNGVVSTATGGSDYLRPTTDVDDTPVNGETAKPISSNWAYDHAAAGRLTEGITAVAFTGGDATPDITNGTTAIVRVWTTADTTTITDFDDGDDHSEFVAGQWFILQVRHAAVIDFSANANIEGNGGADFTGSTTQLVDLLFRWDGTRWICLNLVTPMSDPTTIAISSIDVPTLKASELGDTSDPHLLVVGELKNKIITNSESAGADEWDFPARAEGWNFIFIKEADQNVTLDPNGTEQWYFRTSNGAYAQLAAGEAIVNTSAGKSQLTCFSTESAVYCTGDTNWAEESP